MQTIWQGRVTQVAAKYGEHAQTATVCCNACRTCVQTNLLALGIAALGGAVAGVTRFFGRGRRSQCETAAAASSDTNVSV